MLHNEARELLVKGYEKRHNASMLMKVDATSISAKHMAELCEA